MRKKTFFITGTDTDAGKTVVTCGLLVAAKLQGFKTLGLKPVASGCVETSAGLRNDDAMKIIDTMTHSLAYEQVNPVAFVPAVAPHIAASETDCVITIEQLTDYCRSALMAPVNFALIEGAGGWRVPVNKRQVLSELPKVLGIPVILIVGMKLGCINHALLTVEAIMRDGLPLAGWVANQVNPDMARYKENMATLKTLITAPCLGEVPYMTKISSERVATYLDLRLL